MSRWEAEWFSKMADGYFKVSLAIEVYKNFNIKLGITEIKQ